MSQPDHGPCGAVADLATLGVDPQPACIKPAGHDDPANPPNLREHSNGAFFWNSSRTRSHPEPPEGTLR
jgi:hypothetical protein